MLTVNEKRSGIPDGPGPKKLRVTIEGQGLEEVQGTAAKELATKTAAENGFGNAGLCDMPNAGAFHAETGEYLGDEDAFNPDTPVGGYRAEFTFQQRL